MELTPGNTPSDAEDPRQIIPQWNHSLIAASIAISLLGAFTSTQLMCQARTSRYFSGVLLWTVLGSLTFGFSSIWSLHAVAMLACELDLQIGLDLPLTIFSSVLAVVFTFVALASDLLWESHTRGRRKLRRKTEQASRSSIQYMRSNSYGGETADSLLQSSPWANAGKRRDFDAEVGSTDPFDTTQQLLNSPSRHSPSGRLSQSPRMEYPQKLEQVWSLPPDRHLRPGSPQQQDSQPSPPNQGKVAADDTEGDPYFGDGSLRADSSDATGSRPPLSAYGSSTSSFGLSNMMSGRSHRRTQSSAMNAFALTGKVLFTGLTRRNITKGFLWSLAITSMHYVGILGLQIPEGYVRLDLGLVVLSALISWAVCTVGSILMAQMETHLTQQLFFSAVATSGVAAMHFTGMEAATFWSHISPTEARGYPSGLATAIATIAITTCIAANALLAHSATVSRNKLVEIVQTRKKMWLAIAQKENAEAAALARSDFIASASHEIRTPLHQLQGYSDLLSQTDLTKEGRLLLGAIQQATRSLSLITNNVLDWSRLERDGEAVCQPINIDIRAVCESIVNLLPNRFEDTDTDLMIVIAPDVPSSLFLDETYVHRILMNLLSNALKFTKYGYVLLIATYKDAELSVSVKDTGCGIPPSFLPDLFEPFKQVQTLGSQRGTGLGLSIIKQLLHKMNGSIDVTSVHHTSGGDQLSQSGSTFTVTLPAPLPTGAALPGKFVRRASEPVLTLPPPVEDPTIALCHLGNPVTLIGLVNAWKAFGFEVIEASDPDTALSSLPDSLKYIWADPAFLRACPVLLLQLLEQESWLVLIPYHDRTELQEVPGLVPMPAHFIPIQTPLLWHAIARMIVQTNQRQPMSKTRTVQFAPEIDIFESRTRDPASAQPASNPSTKKRKRSATASKLARSPVIMLVEDNKINQQLGHKMLSALGYSVILAGDGQEAIDLLLKPENDRVVDAILMDQSMPRMDGLTATREIRELEAQGRLRRRRPIIAVTAVVSAESASLCREVGTDDFLAKPLSLRKLQVSLASHLSAAAS